MRPFLQLLADSQPRLGLGQHEADSRKDLQTDLLGPPDRKTSSATRTVTGQLSYPNCARINGRATLQNVANSNSRSVPMLLVEAQT